MKPIKKRGVFSGNVGMKRREFLSYAVATASIATVISACDKNDDNNGGIDLGSGDTGILNYFYALEQLQAAFYVQVINIPYNSLTGDELSLITDIRNHEIAHSGFFKTLIGINAIPPLQFDFSSVNFSNRDSVLGTAKMLKDTTVSAYNGAAQLISSTDYLVIAGKIVSVEARHAGYIRDLLSYGSFADDTIIDVNGLDLVQSPDAVMQVLSPFFVSKLDASHLPTA